MVSAKEKLELLRQAKAGDSEAKRRLAEIEKDDEDAYEYVDEDQYAQYVEEANDFVVDEDGEYGYRHDGNKEWFDEEHQYADYEEAEEERGPRRKKNDGMKKPRGPKAKLQDEKAPLSQRISTAFMNASNRLASTAAPDIGNDSSRGPAPVATGTEVLSNFLSNLEAEADGDVADEAAPVAEVTNEAVEHILMPTETIPQQQTTAVTAVSAEIAMAVDVEGEKSAAARQQLTETGDTMDIADTKPAVAESSSTITVRKAPVEKQKTAFKVRDETVPPKQAVSKATFALAGAGTVEKKPAMYDGRPVEQSDAFSNVERQLNAVGAGEGTQEIRKTLSMDDGDPKRTKANSAFKDLLLPNEDGSKTLCMFWLDAHENMGYVYLFGKVFDESKDGWSSCCVRVEDPGRRLYLLPRKHRFDVRKNSSTDDPVTIEDVKEEIEGILSRQQTKIRFKAVSKKYAFELPGVPAEGEYLEVQVSGDSYTIDPNRTFETFSHVFGTNTALTERLVMDLDLMGPCYLEIKNPTPVPSKFGYSKFECTIPTYSNGTISKIDPDACPPPPPLNVVSLNVVSRHDPKSHAHEVLAVAGVVHDEVSIDGTMQNLTNGFSRFALVSRPAGQQFPSDLKEQLERQRMGSTVQVCNRESALLSHLVANIQCVDPDVIIAHNFFGFTLDVLLHRMKHHNVSFWSRLGRLQVSKMPHLSTTGGGEAKWGAKQVMAGRLLVDTYEFSREVSTRLKTYSMMELASVELGVRRQSIPLDNIGNLYASAQAVINLARYADQDATINFLLANKLQIIPLSRQLTTLAGNIWSRTLTGGRAERNEWMLLHEFHRRNYIVPDKFFGKKDDKKDDGGSRAKAKGQSAGRKKPQYSGGLVLEPKKGFYNTFILLLDFNSLYPSIIQEFNICFTTVERPKGEEAVRLAEEAADGDPDALKVKLPASNVDVGVLPSVLEYLVSRRREVKRMMKGENDPLKLSQLDVRQYALKIMCNSMYGCLGFGHARFYAKPLAEVITQMGRELLQQTVNVAESELNLSVIYGDTDSIMINTQITDYAKTMSMGQELKKLINKRHKKLEIDIDGVFKTMLLLKKKKYAALKLVDKGVDPETKEHRLTTEREVKGIDIVRRDWSGIAVNVGGNVLDQILTAQDRESLVDEIHAYLRKVGNDVAEDRIPLDRYVITKSLTKSPDMYPDARSMPHVQVALRMKSRGEHKRAGDAIEYIICTTAVGEDPNAADTAEQTKQSAALRAYHPSEVKKLGLHIDQQYYLKQQLHAVVSRLVEPIAGTDAGQVAECLGLDSKQFLHAYQREEGSEARAVLSAAERFKDVDKVFLRCNTCQEITEFKGAFRTSQTTGALQHGLTCNNDQCDTTFEDTYVINVLNSEIRRHYKAYGEGWMVCDEPSCSHRTRQVSIKPGTCIVPGCFGTISWEYSSFRLYNQLRYFLYLTDIEASLSELGDPRHRIQAEIMAKKTGLRDVLTYCHQKVDQILKWNRFRFVGYETFQYASTSAAAARMQKAAIQTTSAVA
eukprot:Clim_evm72s218 gene=Clim_evmTU72s218